MPSFNPETCDDVEDDEDDAPPAFDAGKIFIFFAAKMFFSLVSHTIKTHWEDIQTNLISTQHIRMK